MLGSFRKPKTEKEARRRLEAALHEALALGPNDVVRINEVSCGAQGCPDVIIALTIMREAEKTTIYRVERDLATLTLDDLLHAMRPPADDPRAMPLADALTRLRP